MLLISTGMVTIQRINGATQLLYNVLPSVRANVQRSKEGGLQDIPSIPPGANQTSWQPIFYITIGGWDENNKDGTTPYEHYAGDILSFTGSRNLSVLTGTYQQIIQTTPEAGLGLDCAKLPCIRLTTSTTILSDNGVPADDCCDTFEFNQTVAASTWTINHNLDKHPSVTVVDSAGTKVAGQVYYASSNSIVLTFNSQFSGKAYLN